MKSIAKMSLPARTLLLAVVVACSNVALPRDSSVGMAEAISSCASAAPPLTPTRVRKMLIGLKTLNYYPERAAMTNMWTHWNAATINRDFETITSLHVNTVRIAIFTPTFGYPSPSSTMLNRLAQLISTASNHGLRVQLTIFAYFSKFDDLEGSMRWAHAVLAPYRNDPRIAFIDLQNELDNTNAHALGWARKMLPCVRNDAGSIPLTVSVSGSASVAGLRRLKDAHVPVDFYDLHYYGLASLAYGTFQQAIHAVGPVPVYIGETGVSTLPTTRSGDYPDSSRGWWESYQDQYYRTVQYAAAASGLPAAAPWIYSDYPPGAIPPSKTASNPSEYDMGLYRTDGSPKPAAASIRDIFSGKLIDTSFNNGFEQGDGAVPDMPTNWLVYQHGYATFARDTTVAHSGTASARISNSHPDAHGYPGFYLSPIVCIRQGWQYSATVWARGKDATGVTHVTLAWFDTRGKYISSASSINLPLGTVDWQQLRVNAIAPPDAAFVQVHLQSANNRGTVWFDDVTFS